MKECAISCMASAVAALGDVLGADVAQARPSCSPASFLGLLVAFLLNRLANKMLHQGIGVVWDVLIWGSSADQEGDGR